jgi:hypothetical protein
MQAKRPKGQMDRTAFLALADLEVPAFYSLRRRDQFPLRPPPELGIERDVTTGWSPISALSFIVSTALVDRYAISRDRAAQIAGQTIRVVSSSKAKWPEVVAGATAINEGREPPPDILLASLDVPGIQPTKKKPDPVIEIGTLENIARNWPNASAMIAVSITRCAADMRNRAIRHKIDLGDFWGNG